MKSSHFPLFTPFKPDRSIVSLFTIIFVVAMLFFGAIFVAAGYLSGSLLILGAMVAIVLIVICWYAFWIWKYYESIWFELKDDEVSWKRGVWFRQTGIVPYDRITNIDIYQGPLMRYFGFSLIKLQTAGYSGQYKAEITLEGIVEAEELRETLRSLIRDTRTMSGATDATGTRVKPAMAISGTDELITEVRAIRELLEKRGGY
jgi:hypothetical protein